MEENVLIPLSDEQIDDFRRNAAAAGKPLEQFLSERLTQVVPSTTNNLPERIQQDLQNLERSDDAALELAARKGLSDNKQREYDRLLSKQAEGLLTTNELAVLAALGEEARRLTLMRAHALMLLKWRGHNVKQAVSDEVDDTATKN